MNKNATVLTIVLLLTGVAAYVFKDALFLKDTVSEVSSLNEEMLTRHIVFKKDTPESVMVSLKASLESMQGVKSVEYISVEQGLQDFKNRHPEAINDEVVLEAATATILPKLEIILKSDDGGKNSKMLKEFIASSSAAAYVD